MKIVKIALISCILLLLVTCGKERKFNNRLDGTWEAEEFLGVRSTEKTQFKFTFEKETRSEGYGVMFIRSGSSEYTEGFTYTIDGDQLNLFSASNFYFFQIDSYTRNSMLLTDDSNRITRLERE